MACEETDIPTHKKWQGLGAAAYLAVLAYPEDKSKRDTFINAYKAWVCKLITNGQLKRRLIYKEEILKFSTTRKIESQFNRIINIISDKRAVALEIALLSLFQENFKKRINLNLPNGKKFSIKQYLDLHYPSHGNSTDSHSAHNAHKRIWLTSKPVIHLALALDYELKKTNRLNNLEDLLLDPSWLPGALKNSEIFRKMFCSSSVLNIKESNTIKLTADDSP